ncbi:hypothetical protein [Pseudomonas sp.]|uniref:hypothetical protein n=1 Tax=Pseudomonas sp. TaxID=306 RepID=UPI0028AE9BF2|nr:hypothetical protein [Pseudomonas sp.]
MSNRFEIFVAIINKVEKPGFQVGAAAAIHDPFKTDSSGFSLVVQGSQTAGAIAAVLAVEKMTHGAVPFINIATNTLAGSVTFLKIVAKYKSESKINFGDSISLVGNIAGVVAGFVALAGLPTAAAGFTAIALGAALIGAYNSKLAEEINKKLIPVFDMLAKHDISQEPPESFIAPDLTITDVASIHQLFAGRVQAITWHPESEEIKIESLPLYPLIYPIPANPAYFFEPASPPGHPITPAITPIVPHHNGGATVTIGIESINGVPPTGPTPSITVPVGNQQDQYVCSSGNTQDSYKN